MQLMMNRTFEWITVSPKPAFASTTTAAKCLLFIFCHYERARTKNVVYASPGKGVNVRGLGIMLICVSLDSINGT